MMPATVQPAVAAAKTAMALGRRYPARASHCASPLPEPSVSSADAESSPSSPYNRRRARRRTLQPLPITTDAAIAAATMANARRFSTASTSKRAPVQLRHPDQADGLQHDDCGDERCADARADER